MAKLLRHPLNQSRLYAITSKSRLAEVLNLPSRKALSALIAAGDEKNYREFQKDRRDIQHPIGKMAECHKHLAILLRRIEVPDYVHSQKKHSYVTNAETHATGVAVIKTDISKYFPSTKFSHVQRLFSEDLKCPADVSWHLSKICTFGGHIPTGSKFSNSLAFLANRPLFDQINEYAKKKNCTMTMLQDDIAISGDAASKEMLNEVLGMIRRWGLRPHAGVEKTKTYSASSVKVITGVVVKGNSIALPNRRHKLMSDAFRRATAAKTKAERAEAIRELRGRIHEADQISPEMVDPRFRRLANC